jgi:hypothetical protein
MRNDRYFQPPTVTATYLTARGFGPSGARSGGLRHPAEVGIPAGAVLFRLYHDPRVNTGNGGGRHRR